MKRILFALSFVLIMVVGANAQNTETSTTEKQTTEKQTTEGKNIKEKASKFFQRLKDVVEEGGTRITTAIGPGANQKSEPKVQDTTTIGTPLNLKIGINVLDVPLAGSPGSRAYNEGRQEGVRQKVNSENKDATRYLTNAVQENNVERARKLLDAGASAYIDYSMIDNKQYEIMDLMHKSNPKLIRFSQLLHYACAHSDPKMVDFLIERGASLDLCGDYLERIRDANWGYLTFQRCYWNSDRKLRYTPQDVAFNYNNEAVLKHITQKYGKRPTVYGYSSYIYELISTESADNQNAERVMNLLESGKLLIGDGEIGTDALTEVINTPYYALYRDQYTLKYLIVSVVDFIGAYKNSIIRANKYNNDADKLPIYKRKVQLLEKMLRFLIDKGADVNVSDKEMSVLYVGVGDDVSVHKSALMTALAYEDMLDEIRLLKKSGAITQFGYTQRGGVHVVSIDKVKMRDEYRELLLTGELWDD